MSMTPDIADRLSRRARTAASDAEVLARLSEIVGADSVLVDEERVEPYAQDALKEKFPPEAASYKNSYIGGNIAENAGGIRSAKYGVTKHYVLGLEVVLPTGEIIQTGGRVSKNVVGFDLTGLVCGSEGMLGIITEATLKLLPLPEATRTVRATFKTMAAACACPPAFTRERVTPVAIEVLDRNSIRAVETEFAFGIGRDAGALLLVSVDGQREEVERAARVVEEVVKTLVG